VLLVESVDRSRNLLAFVEAVAVVGIVVDEPQFLAEHGRFLPDELKGDELVGGPSSGEKARDVVRGQNIPSRTCFQPRLRMTRMMLLDAGRDTNNSARPGFHFCLSSSPEGEISIPYS